MKFSHLNLDKIKTDIIRVIFCFNKLLAVKDERGKGSAYAIIFFFLPYIDYFGQMDNFDKQVA